MISDTELPLAAVKAELMFLMVDTPAGARSDTLAAPLRVARHLGAGPVVLASLTGLSRQAVHAALKRRTVRLSSDAGLTVVAAIARGPETPTSVAGILGVDEHELLPVINRLERAGLLKSGSAGGTRVLLPGEGAESWLRERLDYHRWVRIDQFSVYLRLDPMERQSVADAAASVLGAGNFTVLPAGIANHVRTDELAFGVAAGSQRDAVVLAKSLWDEIRSYAELAATQLPLAEILDPAVRVSHQASSRR